MLNNFEMDEAEREAVEMVKDYFESGSADSIQALFAGDGSVLEAILYTIYQEALNSGDLMPTTYLHQASPEQMGLIKDSCDCGGTDHEDHVPASPVMLAPAIVLRHMMHSAMCIGIHYHKNLSKLVNIWRAN